MQVSFDWILSWCKPESLMELLMASKNNNKDHIAKGSMLLATTHLPHSPSQNYFIRPYFAGFLRTNFEQTQNRTFF